MDRNAAIVELDKFIGLHLEPFSNEEFSSKDGRIFYGDRLLNENSLECAAKWSSIPSLFLKRCDDDLKVTLLNHFFSKMDYAYPASVCKDDEILSFTNPNSRLWEVDKVVDKIFELVPEVNIDRVYAVGDWISMYASTSVGQKPVSPGDIVNGGGFVNFSPFSGKPEVSKYLLRLVCTNGMIRTEISSKYSSGYDQDPYEWIGSQVLLHCNSVSDDIDTFRRMKDVTLNGNTSALLSHAISDLPRAMQREISDLVMDNRPETLYDLMNLVTSFASHNVDDPRLISRAMGSGGSIVEHYEVCPTCHRVIDS